jgi:hypothetical protein
MSTGFNLIGQSASPYVMLLNVDASNNNCLDTDYISPNPFLGQTFVVNPGEAFEAKLYRKDGHGCNGEQGVFQVRPTFIIRNAALPSDYQQFSFDSDGGIALVGTAPNYGSQLSQPGGSGTDATWILTVAG